MTSAGAERGCAEHFNICKRADRTHEGHGENVAGKTPGQGLTLSDAPVAQR